MHYHALDGSEFWNESAYYRFSSEQIDELERATYELYRMCLDAVDHVVCEQHFDRFQISEPIAKLIEQSWEKEELSIYGRFDLAYDGLGPPKMLEFNADTPTALLEAAVIQWYWFKDRNPHLDQFNAIHERLIETWKNQPSLQRETVYFTCPAGSLEDYITVNYLRDTASQAGLRTQFIGMEQVGWDADRRRFVDLEVREIGNIFKLYPWEWMAEEPFAQHLSASQTRWLEPIWKLVLSSKAILPVLWELFPDSSYLLEASFDELTGSHVRKPIFSREGANVRMLDDAGKVLESDGDYGPPHVYQRYKKLRSFDGMYPVVGSWMVNGYACGIGIREDSSPITRNTSCFVPHVFG